MKREERREFTQIKNSLKEYSKRDTLNHITMLTIKTDASSEYKKALHELYTGYGYHPASICIDTHLLDEHERIHYIYGLTYDLHGEKRPWTDLYTQDEQARFEAALNS